MIKISKVGSSRAKAFSKFSPHAFHLEWKIQVFIAEGSLKAAIKQLTYKENEILLTEAGMELKCTAIVSFTFPVLS